jgi:hypothetical protein
MSRAVPILHLYAFMALTGKTLPFYVACMGNKEYAYSSVQEAQKKRGHLENPGVNVTIIFK